MVGAWLVGVAIAAVVVFDHATTPGADGPTPARWPDASRIARAATAPTLLVFVTPGCPCTRATFTELGAAIDQMRPRPAVVVVVEHGDASYRPPIEVTAIVSDDGTEMARFGARTSGHVALYDAGGALAFTGGVTGERGHIGDNVSRRALVAAASPTPHRVYGCALDNAP